MAANPIPIGYYYSGGTTLSTITKHGVSPGDRRQRGGGRDYIGTNAAYTDAAIYTLGPAARRTSVRPARTVSPTAPAATGRSWATTATTLRLHGRHDDRPEHAHSGRPGAFSDLNVAYGISPNGETSSAPGPSPPTATRRDSCSRRFPRPSPRRAAGRGRDHRAAGLRLEETPVTNRQKCLKRRGAAAGADVDRPTAASRPLGQERTRPGGWHGPRKRICGSVREK